MRKILIPGALAGLAALGLFWLMNDQESASFEASLSNPQKRAEWEHMLTQDPATGKVPVTRAQELDFAKDLPVFDQGPSRSGDYNWEARGPFNYGGRTRGAAFDVRDESIIIAGSVSGGIYKSTDGGQSWKRTTDGTQEWGITCLVQDTRSGGEDTWYAGSGEGYNSASGSSGSRFIGNGILKSIDNGETWQSLASTQNDTPQTLNEWDRIWRVATDPTATSEVVFAALSGRIMRSSDGGENWETVLGGSGSAAYYSDIAISENGICFATLSGDGGVRGIFRSTNGQDWTGITPTIWPGSYNRVVLGINPANEDEVYFMAATPGNGKQMFNFQGGSEWVSLLKYTYITGDGSGAGGAWDNRSENLPRGPFPFDDVNLQGGYNMLVSVSPTNPDLVIIGGTNLFRSTTAFADSNNTTFIGGYGEDTQLPDFQIYDNHHPDQHLVFFSEDNPDQVFSANDGGLWRCDDVNATPVVWTSLNNGYNTTQFYTVAMDHGTEGSKEVMGGLQDNGTFYNNNGDPFDWKFPWSYDGAFTAIADGGAMHLTSIQLGRMFKLQIDQNGNRTAWKRFDPIGPSGYSFIHPWAMDPNDNGIVFLPVGNRVWRNNIVDELPLDNGADSISDGWLQFPFLLTGSGSSVGVSTTNPANRIYVGTSGAAVFRIDDADTDTPDFTDVSNFNNAAGLVNCVAVDPEDGDHAIAVFSNYNVHSIHYTEDGGDTWFRAGGNLEAATGPDGAPEDLYSISNAPSIRWARIVNTTGGKLYLVGTSVGLFATKKLEPGIDRTTDATVWSQVAKDEIGNTVVMMIDHRESDGYAAIATHGAGIFSATLQNNWEFTGLDASADSPSLTLFPQPAKDQMTIQTAGEAGGWKVMDVQGRWKSVAIRQAGNGRYEADVSSLESGIYILQGKVNGAAVQQKFMVL